VSKHTKHDLIEKLDIPAQRIHVVYNAADARFHPIHDRNEIMQVMHKYGLPESGYVLYVGTLEPRKNLVRLIEAYAAMLDQYGDDTPLLVLAGSKGWLYQDIIYSVERFGLQEQIIFTGFVADEDLPAVYSNALFFVYPSLYEGFGLPVLEAMACGIPVIASSAGSLPEIVGDAGMLVKPTDTQALMQAMTILLDNSEQRSRLSASGLKRASTFSWERAAHKTLTVYEKAIRQSK
jgi:glycosyltransferase involved in cell wall biosynthesis